MEPEHRIAELEYKLRSLRQVFNAMSGGVLVIDMAGKVECANRSARALLQMNDEIIGKSIDELLPNLSQCSGGASLNDLTETRITLDDGTSRLLGFTISPIEDGGGFVVLFRDLTVIAEKRKRRRRAEELALVGDMISRLSHEIKNPLASVIVGLRTLERGIPKSSEHSVILGLISQEADSLAITVNRLLDAARPRPLSFRPVDVPVLLAECLESNKVMAARRGVGLELASDSISCVVMADDRSLLKVLESLVHNSLDACSRGGLISLGCSRLDEPRKENLLPGFAGDVVSICVEDDGSGIPREIAFDESAIFKAFVGAKSSGGGLGLTVSRDIVESHGGVIVVEPKPGKGTRVQILLPGPENVSCWGWRSQPGDNGCATNESDCSSCDIRINDLGRHCWMFKDRSYYSEAAQWPELCLKCGFFKSLSLMPFFKSRLVFAK